MKVGGRRGWPTLELLALDLKEAWRFPIPELLAFLYVFFPLLFAPTVRAAMITGPEARLLMGMNMASGLMSFITFIIILKNIAYGLANEIRKGLLQTYLTYPIGRGRLLALKVFTTVGVPVLYVLLGIWLFALVNLPELMAEHLGIFLTALAAAVGWVLFLSGLLLLIAILVRRGGPALGLGIGAWFGLSLLRTFLATAGGITGQEAYWHAYYVLSPSTALEDHYRSIYFVHAGPTSPFRPELWQCYAYLASHYALAASFFAAALIYFLRRFEPI